MAGKKKEEADAGAPAWVMTFADLMSLLMCFFVLLLSFSELDRKKYKQVAGSMSQAFGVQREIPTQESLKGVTIIAQEFAPGKPQPTMERVLRQETTDDTQDYLEVLEAIERVQEKSFGDERGLVKGNTDTDEWIEGEGEASIAGGKSGGMGDGTQAVDSSGDRKGEAGGRSAEEISAEAQAMEEALQRALEDAQKQAEALKQALDDEIDQQLLQVEAKEQGVLIKVREQGSFPSGQASLNRSFLPVLRKIAGALISDSSELVVAGHTDDIPISTGRYPSNWELSAARASSVLQGFVSQHVVARERLELRAFADTEPVAPNDSPANRAQNRRVEIFINTMPDIADKAASKAVNQGTQMEATADPIVNGTVEPGEEFEL